MVDPCDLIESVKSRTPLLASDIIKPCFARPSVLQSSQRIVAGFYLTCNSYQPISPLLPLFEELQHCHFPVQKQAHCWKPSAANLVHIIVNDAQQDATILVYLFIPNQLYTFRAVLAHHQEHLTVFTASDIVH